MPRPILIKAGPVSLEAELFDTLSARTVFKSLPVTTSFNVWGDEFYFRIPVDIPLDETATTEVKVGDIGYWPDGNAMAIFFGPTPISTGPDPLPAGKVNIIGKVRGDARELIEAKSAGEITVRPL